MRLWVLLSSRREVSRRCLRRESAMERWAGVSELRCCRWKVVVLNDYL
jgi:hypothetical protein